MINEIKTTSNQGLIEQSKSRLNGILDANGEKGISLVDLVEKIEDDMETNGNMYFGQNKCFIDEAFKMVEEGSLDFNEKTNMFSPHVPGTPVCDYGLSLQKNPLDNDIEDDWG